MFHVIRDDAKGKTFQGIIIFLIDYHRVDCATMLVPMNSLNLILNNELIIFSKV